MNKSYWKVLLENIKTKPTIPYILGAKLIVHPNSKIESVDQLLHQIIHSNDENIYTIYFCPDIREYVIFLNFNNNYIIEGLKVYNPQTKHLKIVFGINTASLGNNFNKIQNSLSKRYESNLSELKFSYVNYNWINFTIEDKNLLLTLMKSYKH